MVQQALKVDGSPPQDWPGQCRPIDLHIAGDDRGSLISLQPGSPVPFDIARTYYIFDTKQGVSRGFHAHRHLTQLAVAVSGSCRMVLDDGESRRELMLNRPDRGVLISPMVWREMHDFSPGCVLMVLADRAYEPDDYLRDYDAFAAEARHA